ncbi:hypothetical protein Ddye_008181, partial [Dipteronia dyeriana]
MNNDRNNGPNVGLIHEVDNEVNLLLVDNIKNNEEDEEPIQIERRRARRLHRYSYSATDIAGISEVGPNVIAADSDNATMWVIPGAESYSFGMGGSRNLDEPTCMICKGQFFPTKMDLKRLVGHFTMRHNFEWKLRAVRRDETTYFQVRGLFNEHTSPLEEIHCRHRQASAVIISEMVAPGLQQHDGRLMHPKDIIADMKT